MGPSSAMRLIFFSPLPRGCQAHVRANSSFILSAQEMNHRCNLIRLLQNPAQCATSVLFVGALSVALPFSEATDSLFRALQKAELSAASKTNCCFGSVDISLALVLVSGCTGQAGSPAVPVYGNARVRARTLGFARVNECVRSRACVRVCEWERSDRRTHFGELSVSVSLSVSKAASSCRSS